MKIIADPMLRPDEVKQLVDNEKQAWKKMNKEIAEIQLILQGDEVCMEVKEKSPIKRVRRITGYLSNIENFNEAKRAECTDRRIHAG